MYKTYQSFVALFIFVLHFHYALANQPDTQVDPGDFMLHGRDLYKNMYPYASDFPLKRAKLPLELHLNYSIPEPYRQAAREAASAWNRRVGLRLVTISDEIDESDWDPNQQDADLRNVIYWIGENQHQDMLPGSDPSVPPEAVTDFQLTSFRLSMENVFIHDTDILIHSELSTVIGAVRWLLNWHLNEIGVEYSEDMDVEELRQLFLQQLSHMSGEEFYNMVIRLMEDQRVTIPDSAPEEIQRWIVERINGEVPDIQPLGSFEDLRALIIKEYEFDFTSIADNTALFRSISLHEIGHTLGLDHHDEAALMREFPISPIPRFPRHLTQMEHIDDLTLHGLSCSYDLENLRELLPL